MSRVHDVVCMGHGVENAPDLKQACCSAEGTTGLSVAAATRVLQAYLCPQRDCHLIGINDLWLVFVRHQGYKTTLQ